MANDVRPVDANELLKESIYCKGEDGSMLYAVPTSRIFAAPTVKLEGRHGRPVAHWVEIPGSYRDHVGKDGSWFGPATRCSNPDCREVNPCSLKTPFCPMCGFRMGDVPYDND